jgi:hypothetical protein
MALSPTRQSAPSFEVLPPELKQEIFGYLEGDNASLFAVIQVSKACHNCCIGMLWRRPTQEMLAKVPTPQRRQHYANVIFRWTVDRNFSCEVFDGLDFPLLKDISVIGGPLSIVQLRHCLQAGLHTLRYMSCKLDAAMLELTATCCRQLQRLRIEAFDLEKVTPGQFLAFLQSFPALRRLELGWIPEDIIERVFEMEAKVLARLEGFT